MKRLKYTQGDSNNIVPQFGKPFETYTDRLGVYVIIFNAFNEVLTVATERGPYLPGGGVDREEGITEALRREVFEETGYSLKEVRGFAKANQFAIHPTAGPVNKLGVFYLGTIDQDIPQYSAETRNHTSFWMKVEDFLSCETDEFHQYAVRRAVESQ